MLILTIKSSSQKSQYRHDQGPLVLGRLADPVQAHVVLDDEYVSRRQLLLEETVDACLRIENLGRNPVYLPDGEEVPSKETRVVNLPVRLRVGNTFVEVALDEEIPFVANARGGGDDDAQYDLCSLPATRQFEASQRPSLASLGEVPSAEKLTLWFETLLSIQQSAIGSNEFYRETSQALVDLVGLDRGLVLLQEGGAWRIAAGHTRKEDRGLDYSKTVVGKVQQEQRTFFGNPQSMAMGASTDELEAVVASPILGEGDQLVGILYGSRDCMSESASKASGGEIQLLEAQVVQLLATSISSGLIRMNFQRRLKQVEQLALVGQALGYIVHDLRGPLGNVQQLLEMVREGHDEQLSREEQLDLIDRSLAIALDLLNDSLEFCRGSICVELVTGNFLELMETHLALLRVDMKSRGVALSIDVPAGLILRIDPDRMARVLSNLTRNAAEAMRDQADATITIGARESSTKIELTVSDNGPGLPLDVQRKLFKPFATQGKTGGTGFGLAIAKQLVEAHNGVIAVTSSEKGTRFTITLPAVDKNSKDDDETVVVRTVPKSNANFEKKEPVIPRYRVLLVDDSHVNQRLIGSMLRAAGHEVTIASNGRRAVAAWQADAYDVILMDVEMPDMGGTEATRAIRQLESSGDQHVPIIALTAHQSPDAHRDCQAAGMDDVLIKPVREEELNRILRIITP